MGVSKNRGAIRGWFPSSPKTIPRSSGTAPQIEAQASQLLLFSLNWFNPRSKWTFLDGFGSTHAFLDGFGSTHAAN